MVVSSGQRGTGLDVLDWAKKAEALGAGEILLTSKDTDGTREGYDIEMTRSVAEVAGLPVIASGGAGTVEHMYAAITAGRASAVLAASVFHFGQITIPEARAYLQEKGVSVKSAG